MTEFVRNNDRRESASTSRESRSIDWYAEGEARTVEIGGLEVIVRFVGRKGRRARIAISAPAGVVFREGGDIRETKAADRGRCDES